MVGREAELAQLSALLGGSGTGLRVALLTGEPGSGKSTLVDAVVDRAAGTGHTVLSTRPRAPEQPLAFNGLADVLAGVELDSVPLAPPQRTALLRALLLENADGVAAEPLAVAAAARTVLAHQAEREPTLLVIDDGQWLDAPTTLVLCHALRRLGDAPLAFLVASRPVDGPPDWPVGADGERCELTLGGLGPAALFHLVQDRLGHRLGRDALRLVQDVSGGNPMYALALAGGLVDGTVRPGGAGGAGTGSDAARLAPSLEALVGREVSRLPTATRQVLLAAALARDPTPVVLAAACGTDVATLLARLEAGADGVARVEGGRVRFRHPLYAAATEAEAGIDAVRATHAALAAGESDLEARARHLALAAETVDAAVAGLLDVAARHARVRGGGDAARDLLRLALAATPPGDPDEAGRRLDLAMWTLHDGDPEAARRLLEPAVDAPGSSGARARLALARVALLAGATSDVAAHCRAAIDRAGDDVLLRSEALLTLAEVYDDIGDALRCAVEAAELLRGADTGPDGDALLTAAMQREADARLLLGEAAAIELLRQAAGREGDRPPSPVVSSAAMAYATQLLFAQRLDEARPRLLDLLAVVRERGEESSEPMLLLNLGHLETRASRFDLAERYAREAHVLAELGHQQGGLVLAHAQVAVHVARRGDPRRALRDLAGGAAEATRLGDPWLGAIVRLLTGRVHLEQGDPAAAAAVLGEARQLATDAGMVDLGWQPYPGDLAEALVASGDVDRAAEELAFLERRVRPDRPHVAAVLPRIRGQLLAEQGRLAEALAEVEDALARHEALGADFETARSLLVLGRLLRRDRQKRRAHDTLTAAAAAFDRLGTPAWAAQARRELVRVGLRPSAPAELTETEARVADLAAAGRTNREIAAAVFASPKTVEGVLGRVYRKLGVRSRVELARLRPPPPP